MLRVRDPPRGGSRVRHLVQFPLSCRNFERLKYQLSNAVSTKSVRLFVQKLSQFEISEFGQIFGLEPIKKNVTNFEKCRKHSGFPLSFLLDYLSKILES